MERELNDAVVWVVNLILNICHAIALLVLIGVNILLFNLLTQNVGGFTMVVSHLGLSLIFFVSYCLLVSLISVFLSISRNLQRLVALQEVTTNSYIRTVASAESQPKGRSPEQKKSYKNFAAQLTSWEKSRATPPEDA